MSRSRLILLADVLLLILIAMWFGSNALARGDHASVILIRIEGGGHTWPSAPQYLPQFAVGHVNSGIDGDKAIRSFYSQFH